MELSWKPLPLRLISPFAIAHGTSLTRDNVLVRVDDGLGEAAAVNYLGESSEGIVQYLRGLDLGEVSDPYHLADIVGALPAGSSAARAAVDMALHDAWGRRLGQPLYRLLGLNPDRTPLTSLTIPLGSPVQMANRARECGAPLLKVKLGTEQDEARLRALRDATSARLRVDANGGWSVAEATRLMPVLEELGVELAEQPLAVGDSAGLRVLHGLSRRPPLFVDESIRSSSDIVAHAGFVDGVVVKLAKAGGIRGALEQIAVARSLGLDVMLSCMIESSVAVTAAAHIAPLVQYVDLDGPQLIANDPACGVTYEKARLRLPDGPGLGLSFASAD